MEDKDDPKGKSNVPEDDKLLSKSRKVDEKESHDPKKDEKEKAYKLKDANRKSPVKDLSPEEKATSIASISAVSTTVSSLRKEVEEKNTKNRRGESLDLSERYGSAYRKQKIISGLEITISNLARLTANMAGNAKTITAETTKGIRNATMSGAKSITEAAGQFSQAINQDIQFNRNNFIQSTLSKISPLFGYTISKLLDTPIFQSMLSNLKYKFNDAMSVVSNKFKSVLSTKWEQTKSAVSSLSDRIMNRDSVKPESLFPKEKPVKEKVEKVKKEDSSIKDISTISSKETPENKKKVMKSIPHLATGGLVTKEGIVKVHAGEVVQPIESVIETILNRVDKKLDEKKFSTTESGKCVEDRVDEKCKKVKDKLEEAKEEKKKAYDPSNVLQKTLTRTSLLISNTTKDTNSGMRDMVDIMQRRILGLDSRVRDMDRNTKQGLIKSFFKAYKDEAFTHEWDWQDRVLRELISLRTVLGSEISAMSVAWKRTLYEHPIFRQFVSLGTALARTFSGTRKFFFKKRGGYGSNLVNTGKPLQDIASNTATAYITGMTKMDLLISHSASSAKSLISINRILTGEDQPDLKKEGDFNKQWTIGGKLSKLITAPSKFIAKKALLPAAQGIGRLTRASLTSGYGGIRDAALRQLPAETQTRIEQRKIANQGKPDILTKAVKAVIGAPKAAYNKLRTAAISSLPQRVQEQLAAMERSRMNAVKDAERAKATPKSLPDLFSELIDVQKDFLKKFVFYSDTVLPVFDVLSSRMGIISAQAEPSQIIPTKTKLLPALSKTAKSKSFQGRVGERIIGLLTQLKNKSRMTIDRLKQTYLLNKKEHRIQTSIRNGITTMGRKLKGMGGWIWKLVLFLPLLLKSIPGLLLKGVTSFLPSLMKTLPRLFFGLFTKIIPKLLGVIPKLLMGMVAKIGPLLLSGISSMAPALLVGLAAAGGAAIGTAINKYVISPFINAKYKKMEARDKRLRDKTMGTVNKNRLALKSGKLSKKEAIATKQHLKISAGFAASREERQKDYGITTSANSYNAISDAQQAYQDENIGKYIPYGYKQVAELRNKWLKRHLGTGFDGKDFSETPEEYGIRREKAFLEYLQKKGKPVWGITLDWQAKLRSDQYESKDIGTSANDFINETKKVVGGKINKVSNKISDIVKNNSLESLSKPVKNIFETIKSGIERISKGLPEIINKTKTVGSIVKIGLNGQKIINKDTIQTVVKKIPKLAKGGKIEETGLAKVHKGEEVVPAKVVSQYDSAIGSAKVAETVGGKIKKKMSMIISDKNITKVVAPTKKMLVHVNKGLKAIAATTISVYDNAKKSTKKMAANVSKVIAANEAYENFMKPSEVKTKKSVLGDKASEAKPNRPDMLSILSKASESKDVKKNDKNKVSSIDKQVLGKYKGEGPEDPIEIGRTISARLLGHYGKFSNPVVVRSIDYGFKNHAWHNRDNSRILEGLAEGFAKFKQSLASSRYKDFKKNPISRDLIQALVDAKGNRWTGVVRKYLNAEAKKKANMNLAKAKAATSIPKKAKTMSSLGNDINKNFTISEAPTIPKKVKAMSENDINKNFTISEAMTMLEAGKKKNQEMRDRLKQIKRGRSIPNKAEAMTPLVKGKNNKLVISEAMAALEAGKKKNQEIRDRLKQIKRGRSIPNKAEDYNTNTSKLSAIKIKEPEKVSVSDNQSNRSVVIDSSQKQVLDKKDIVRMSTHSDIINSNIAESLSKIGDGLKESSDKGNASNAQLVQSMTSSIDKSVKSITTVNNNGGGSAPPQRTDEYMVQMLTGNIS